MNELEKWKRLMKQRDEIEKQLADLDYPEIHHLNREKNSEVERAFIAKEEEINERIRHINR